MAATRGQLAANDVVMKRTVYPSAVFVLVEGTEDKKFLSRFTSADHCKIVIAHGKPHVREAVDILGTVNGSARFLGVTDVDYDRLEKVSTTGPLLTTDDNDLETVLVRSAALEAALTELGCDPEALAGFERAWGSSIRDMLVRLVQPVGLLRWMAVRHCMSIKFDGVVLGEYINKQLRLDYPSLLAELRGRSVSAFMPDDLVHERVSRLSQQIHSGWDVCNGHDLVQALASFCKHQGFVKNDLGVIEERLGSLLRLAYPVDSFAASQLCTGLLKKEAEMQCPILSPRLREAR